jgi:hypothetical protein
MAGVVELCHTRSSMKIPVITIPVNGAIRWLVNLFRPR